MDGHYVVTFKDGTTEDVSTSDRAKAKEIARAKRLSALDPGGKMDAPDRMKHASTKVVQVQELIDGVLTTLAIVVAALLFYQLDAWSAARMGHVTSADVLQLQGFFGTAIGATLAALAAVPGDALQVPSFSESKKAMILQFWTDVQVAGTARIRSPKFHDNSNGIRKDTIISELEPVLPYGFGLPLYPGDNLIVELAGSAVGGDIEYLVMLQWFETLSAQQANLWTPEAVLAKVISYSYVENTIATGATAAWGGAEAINAETDQFHANRNYALLGYYTDTEVPAIAWRGPDTANARVGGPGLDQDQAITENWFTSLSKAFGKALVPVIQANNKGATLIDTLQDENGADTTVISIYAELPL